MTLSADDLADYYLYLKLWRGLRRKFRDVANARVPNVLFHYTSVAGLQGIIDSTSVFMTDAMFMNDQSELVYGRDLVADVLRSRLRELTDIRQRYAIDVCLNYLTSGVSVLRSFRAYVACFCNNGNLLSQWRAYAAPGSGYALGFDAERMRKSLLHLDEAISPRLIKIEYRRARQEQIVRYAIDLYLQDVAVSPSAPTAANDREAAMLAPLPILLGTLLPQFKHPVFSEEREWRLIAHVNESQGRRHLQFTHRRSHIVPHLTLGFDGALPLVSVTHAPSSEPDMKKEGMRELLNSRGYESVSVLGSDIPLRLN